ncbi:MAG: Hsp20/alpha crystallin family protein [Phycisphaerae bacterium]|nr:Hsp20/alpha crystallin family protein [Phycisphaerae bacterium]
MFEAAPGPDFEELSRRFDDAVGRVLSRHFSQFRPSDTWRPAVNVYEVEDRIEVCLDLAGVERESIDVLVEGKVLTIRGVRQTPRPSEPAGDACHVLVMEIEHGPFERVVHLPAGVDVEQITAEQVNGMLWVRLPRRRGRMIRP